MVHKAHKYDPSRPAARHGGSPAGMARDLTAQRDRQRRHLLDLAAQLEDSGVLRARIETVLTRAAQSYDDELVAAQATLDEGI